MPSHPNIGNQPFIPDSTPPDGTSKADQTKQKLPLSLGNHKVHQAFQQNAPSAPETAERPLEALTPTPPGYEDLAIDTLFGDLFSIPEEFYAKEAKDTFYNPDLPVSPRHAENQANEIIEHDLAPQKVRVLASDGTLIQMHATGLQTGSQLTEEQLHQLEGDHPIVFDLGNLLRLMVPSRVPEVPVEGTKGYEELFKDYTRAAAKHLAQTIAWRKMVESAHPGIRIQIVTVPLSREHPELFNRLIHTIFTQLNIAWPAVWQVPRSKAPTLTTPILPTSRAAVQTPSTKRTKRDVFRPSPQRKHAPQRGQTEAAKKEKEAVKSERLADTAMRERESGEQKIKAGDVRKQTLDDASKKRREKPLK